MKITWLGTASIVMETQYARLLFDPFVELAGASHPNTLDDFTEYTDICITHGHMDHLLFVPELIETSDATVYATAAAADTLSGFLDDNGNVVCIRPGDRFRVGDMHITVYKGRHTVFTPGVILRRLFSPRVLKYARNLPFLAWAQLRFPEKGQTVVYGIEAEGKRVLLMGSMALDPEEDYPTGADLLILPYQGPARPEETAMQIVRRLVPKRVLLDHFDDAFPPASCEVDTRPLKRLMREEECRIPTVKPRAGVSVRI